MVTWHIIQKDSIEDTYGVVTDAFNKVLLIPTLEQEPDVKTVSHDILKRFSKNNLLLSAQGSEIINLGVSVYTGDQLVSRSRNAYDAWSRNYKLHLPVKDFDKWEMVKPEIEEMLSFLSGDKWGLVLRQSNLDETIEQQTVLEYNRVDAVTLFSGGLDSFIGASDLLKSNMNLALVGHHKSQGYENKTQNQLTSSLKSQYKGRNIESLFFYTQPKQSGNSGGKERTSRARSILFITIGLAVADAYGANTPLYIPENGVISLNVPLTNARMGSSSTRTTHPYFLSLLRTITLKLGFKNQILNPYKYKTKGEMLKESKDFSYVRLNAAHTISCAKPGYHKQWHNSDELHCGYCTPCLIRRAAMKEASIDDPQNYAHKVDQTIPNFQDDIGRDYRAFQMGINRMKAYRNPLFFLLLNSGPIPKSEDIAEYTDVYRRGMLEVDRLLQ